MKRKIYIALFAVLGVLISFLIHAVLEVAAIIALTKNFSVFGLGLSWDNWFIIHAVFSIMLLILGLLIGVRQGIYWWKVIYIEKRYKKSINNA